jgi:two-component system response regulator AtoC
MARKVLIVDDRLETVVRYADALSGRGFSVVRCADPGSALVAFVHERPDVVLLDVKMPGKSGLELLKEIRERDGNTCIIMLSAHCDAGTIFEAVGLGADNFADKSYDADKLVLVVEKELRAKEMEAELEKLKADKDGRLRTINDIVGESEGIKAVRRQIMEHADAELAVFITGETGVGKNVVAEALHTQSKRRKKPFKHLLCTSFQPSLLESELFGYEKGAFTDAYRAKRGVIDGAEDGTVFLDEIGAITPEVQSKLLLLTEAGVYSKVGSEGRTQKTGAWFIAATNIDIPKAIQSGQMRQDLFYRLNQAWIHVPPLRERGDDVLLLADHFIRTESEKAGTPPLTMSRKFLDTLLYYSWDGNVRELLSVIRRYVKSGGKDVRLRGASAGGAEPEFQPDGGRFRLKGALKKTVETTEKKWIVEALQRFGGNRTKAAAWLGISRRNLMYKIKRYSLTDQV